MTVYLLSANKYPDAPGTYPVRVYATREAADEAKKACYYGGTVTPLDFQA